MWNGARPTLGGTWWGVSCCVLLWTHQTQASQPGQGVASPWAQQLGRGSQRFHLHHAPCPPCRSEAVSLPQSLLCTGPWAGSAGVEQPDTPSAGAPARMTPCLPCPTLQCLLGAKYADLMYHLFPLRLCIPVSHSGFCGSPGACDVFSGV